MDNMFLLYFFLDVQRVFSHILSIYSNAKTGWPLTDLDYVWCENTLILILNKLKKVKNISKNLFRTHNTPYNDRYSFIQFYSNYLICLEILIVLKFQTFKIYLNKYVGQN